MNNINQDIEKNTMKQFYLLYGEEDYLKKQYRDKLVQALADPDDNMNLHFYEGKRTEMKEVCELGETMPFFAERRVIVVEDSGWFKKAPENADAMFAALPESTCVLFVEREIDKRSRFYKWIDKSGYAAKLDAPDEKMLITWIKGLCKKENKRIEDSAVFYFVEHVGSDMLLLKNELEKVFGYMGERDVITVEDIKELCVSQAEEKMFDMLDAIGNHNQKKALLLYRDMLALKEPAMRILTMLTRHYRILMHARGLIDSETDYGELNRIFKDTWRLQPFAVKKYCAQAKSYSYPLLKNRVEQCQMTEQNVKTGNVQDVVGIELLIVMFSEK